VDRGVKFGRYHVIRNTKQAGILVEGGFLTNAAERKKIATGPYRQAMAEAIGQGILDYQAALKKGVAR
jgi:N-acetylmuramoyl-L-alanine amidase